MYQSPSTIIQNINTNNIKKNLKTVSETSPPQTNTPSQKIISPFLTGMAKGSVLFVGVDAVKLG